MTLPVIDHVKKADGTAIAAIVPDLLRKAEEDPNKSHFEDLIRDFGGTIYAGEYLLTLVQSDNTVTLRRFPGGGDTVKIFQCVRTT